MSNLDIRNTYDFITHAPAILKGQYKNQTVTGVMDHNQASTISDVTTIHSQVYPFLPEGTPESVSNLTFYSFNDGTEVKVLAEEWIIENSIEQVESGSITINIPNASNGDVSDIRSFLATLGYTGFSIEFDANQ